MEKIKKYIGLYPFLIYMTCFYLYGLYYVLMSSFGFFGIEKSEFTLDNYRKVFTTPDFYSSLVYTVKLNLFAAVFSLIISIIILYLIFLGNRRVERFNTYFSKILELPIYISYLIATYGIFILSIHYFPNLVNDDYGVGIILTFVWKTTPFIIMMAIPVLLEIDNKWRKLGTIFGMKDLKFYTKIVLPMLFPTLIMSFFIILAYFFSAFETPYILGKTYPQTLSVYIFELYSTRGIGSRGVVMVLNIILSLFTLSIGGVIYLIMYKLIGEKDRRW